LACLAVTRWALDHARTGQGPVLVEAFTYRMGAHTTSDDPTRYRESEETEAWKAKDPILRLRTHLQNEGWADDAFVAEIDAEAERFGLRLRTQLRAMPDPDPTLIFDHVYSEPHPLVDEERAEYEAYAASFEGGEHH
ncbi:thiamine pyrophosphate-dependent enzyme, partial [Kitasatospora sp. NPDC049285]|uniref:thiamine pyrophosphate-dependent enzyme n=1 Tax=Kitasatospora sp. NPDC049285 TaxID=3157096 RepID=UPI0034420C48